MSTTDGTTSLDPNKLVAAADDALREAKGAGKGAWVRHRRRAEASRADKP